jgi:hypothetical protein
MPSPDLLDRLLALGDRIIAAAGNDEWARLSALVDERARVVERLAQADAPGDDASTTEHAQTMTALADQHDRMMRVLAARRDAVQEELAKIEKLKHAQDSYESPPARRQVLHADLQG